MIRMLLLPLLLAACDAGLPPPPTAAQNRIAPRLVSLDPILAQTEPASRAQAAQAGLDLRGRRIEGRSIAVPATEDIAERGERLRQRAADLRAAEI